MLAVYHHQLCPHSRKLRIVLREKEIDFEVFYEPYWERRTSFLAMNPRGDTPVLKDEDGVMVYGRSALFEYLEEVYPQVSLLGGKSKNLRLKVRQISEWFDDKFYQEVTRYLITEKVIKPAQSAGAPNSDFIRASKRNMLHHMDYLRYLLEKSTYLTGEQITIADISAAAQLSVLDFMNDISWEKFPLVKHWYSLMKSRPSLRSILHDVVSGITPPEHYSNPDF